MPGAPETLRDLADLVERMRSAQRRYFRVRTPAALERSKKYERDVDRACDKILRPRPAEPSLFGD